MRSVRRENPSSFNLTMLSIMNYIAGFALLATQALAYLAANGDVIIPGATSYNGLGLVPQMGFDNWNAFGCNINESILLGTAQKMADYGLRDLGYNYVILDDCWSSGRNESGYLVADTNKFPNGMAHVADQIHALGENCCSVPLKRRMGRLM
jgi:alpha-galactosidase